MTKALFINGSPRKNGTFKKELVDSWVAVYVWMECGSELLPLARSDNMLVDAGNGIAGIRKHCLDVGRTDEGHW